MTATTLSPPRTEPSQPGRSRRSHRATVTWPVLLGWVLGVTGVSVAVVAGFALWLSGGRNEAIQQRGFADFRKAALLMSDGSYPDKVWSKDLPVALVRFQRFGRSVAVFGGVGKAELRRGPGYDPTTAMIGEVGNTVFIGKSSTYGSAFADLGTLAAGDQLVVRSGYGTLAYQVTEVLSVDRGDPAIYEPYVDGNRLSLVAHRGHALSSNRVLVRAELTATGEISDATLPVVPPSSSTGFAPLLVLGLMCSLGLTVVWSHQIVAQFTTQRAASWIAAPFVFAIAVPLAEQLLLALPRTW